MEEQPPEHYSRSEVENVKVAVRCRPLSGLERQQGHRQIVQIDGQARAILVANPHSPNEPEKHYAFDAIFGPDSSQSYVYNSIARPIVDNVLKGFNGTIFAYGQTGTGKTFTMSGDPDSNENGIIQFSFAQIFDHIVKSGHEKRFLVRISYMEIYNEEVRDLLARHSNSTSTTSQSQPRSLEIKERQDIGVYVKDLLNVTVSNADQCMRIMHFGNSNRHTGKTAMNEQSSRSHAIFTITIECSETFVDGRQLLTQGKLSFVDLAGSERQSKTNAVGEQLREATKINLSLSTLGNVISALAEAKSQHIPYRNSKLTRILQDSLGGNSKTCMIANIGPASYNYEETVSTLRYASRAKRIQNVARINEDPKDALLRRFQEEIEQLKRALEDVEPESDAENKSDDENHHIVVLSATDEAHKQQENLKATKKEGNVDAHDASASNNQNAAERRRLAEDLLRRNEELKRNKLEREKLTQKLMTIERQIIVGGENMLEKAELQAQLLDESNQDLEQARQNEQTLHERFRNQQAEHLDIEERNSSMQEQAHGLGKKLKKVWVQYMQTKQELHDQEMEHNRETETLLETIRQLEREFAFSSLVIDQFVPVKQQRFIERHTHWNEEIGDWQLRCIAYTGNNIREDHRLYNPHYKATDPQLMPLFLNYADFMEPSMGNNSSHPDSASSSTSSHTAKARIKEAARIQALLE